MTDRHFYPPSLVLVSVLDAQDCSFNGVLMCVVVPCRNDEPAAQRRVLVESTSVQTLRKSGSRSCAVGKHRRHSGK